MLEFFLGHVLKHVLAHINLSIERIHFAIKLHNLVDSFNMGLVRKHPAGTLLSTSLHKCGQLILTPCVGSSQSSVAARCGVGNEVSLVFFGCHNVLVTGTKCNARRSGDVLLGSCV